MTYILLMVMIIIFLFLFYKKFDNDILSPTVISFLMYLFGIILAAIGLFYWNDVYKLSYKTILIIFSGLIFFALGEFVSRKKRNTSVKREMEFKTITIEKWKYVLTIIGVLVTGLLLILEIKRICNFYGFYSNNLSSLLGFYRTKIGLFSTDLIRDGMEINFIVKQMKKVCDVICIIYMYIVLNNFFSHDKIKNLIKDIIPVVITLALTLLTSGRSLLMHMAVASFMMFLLLYRKKHHNDNITKKVLVLSSIVLFLVLGVFYAILPLLGRSSNNGFLEYITFYLGVPIPSLDIFINGIPEIKPFGSETFSGVYYVLNKFNIIDYMAIGSLEWISFGNLASNVYTSFRRYYFDFGIFGVMIFQFIFGYCISKLYLYVKSKNNIFPLLIYGYFSYILIDQIRDEQFFSLINTSTIAILLIFGVLYWFYFKFNINHFFKKGDAKKNELCKKNHRKNKKQ